ncbi:class I SAM-dependent methyltransferase [Kribbella sp. NBC_01505]|uniref:class I SAM-dependent methyltransferase n=1 Tax=Kribbella sp. NBC_01505 TaxID=2903580 RepID=UPI003870AAE6
MTTVAQKSLAAIYDPFVWLGERRGMRRHRSDLLSGARGRVLEIGAGTGLNVPHYPNAVQEMILTEPVPGMFERLQRRAGQDARATLMPAVASSLPVESASVDTVVSTFVLCTVPDVDAVLTEVRRVLKPGGRFLFCEHVRADDARSAARQDRWADAWAAFAQQCRCNRDTMEALQSHFQLTRVERRHWLGMPSLVKPVIVGEAVVS